MANNLAIRLEGPGQPMTEDELRLEATGMEGEGWSYTWHIRDARGKDAGGEFTHESAKKKVVVYRLPAKHGLFRVEVTALRGDERETEGMYIPVQPRPLTKGDRVPVDIGGDAFAQPIAVNLRRSDIIDTPDLPLWSVIRASTEKLAFNNYADWMDSLFCGDREQFRRLFGRYVSNSLPFPDIISYKALKFATEAFLLTNCGVAWAVGDLSELREFGAPIAPSLVSERFDNLDRDERDERLGLDRGDTAGKLWRKLLTPIRVAAEADENGGDIRVETLPYLALVRRNLPEWRIELNADAEEQVELCDTIMGRKFTSPCFLELLWSYWHEEGMLVQTMNAISMRFQNRSSGQRDPLAALALDPLRPLNNLLWGYIQDEQHRLTLARRVYEYDHEYGLTLFGRAVPRLRSADPRSRFLEAFHTLLHRASIFYKEDDDTTMIADPFPVLNALRDVHLLLAEGAHNQYGDLPWTARHEMLMQQWLLARPELRDFLPTRVMVAYPEPWMDRVDAMKRAQGWTDTSVRYFRDLGVFGEQILLSIRFGNWSAVFDREHAGNWARYWRQEVQWYIHAYQTVTGVDLSSDMQDVRRAELRSDRYRQPAYHLQQRLIQQRRETARQRSRDGLRRGARVAQIEIGAGFEGEAADGGTARRSAAPATD
jgi:hypothetical protein